MVTQQAKRVNDCACDALVAEASLGALGENILVRREDACKTVEPNA